ncbi:modulator of DNA gyrase family protein [Anaplasma phagocytophilum str. CRT53-1]|uniref:Modulator of DNA gyrase family protein n=2 Tax=Anaplasma phagocytophilum TaxID=948 RepID=A0A0F3Q140_ANAPH|nr:modulator of DNA gyrase family protein [Anaplasma phagocytophilum str. CRT53-1]KJV85967.1 modulator of DNA gyrase family protein [Anaplasma phagocytophilum str. CRT53-1]
MRLKEMIASSGCNVGIRVIVGKKYSCISSNDLERSEELVEAAVKMADLSPIEGLFLLYFSYLVRGFLLTVFQKQILHR